MRVTFDYDEHVVVVLDDPNFALWQFQATPVPCGLVTTDPVNRRIAVDEPALWRFEDGPPGFRDKF